MVQNISIQIAIWIIFGACKQCKSHTGLPRTYRSAFAGLSSFCEFFASQRLAPLLPLGFDPETEATKGVTQPTIHIIYKLAVGYLKFGCLPLIIKMLRGIPLLKLYVNLHFHELDDLSDINEVRNLYKKF